MTTVPPLRYPITIFHKYKAQPYYFEDSFHGILYAKRCGATAIDLDCTISKDGWIIVNHWSDILNRGGYVDPLHECSKDSRIENLDWLTLKRFRANEVWHPKRAVDAIKFCAENNLTPCFEVKNDHRFEKVSTYNQIVSASNEYRCPVVIMTLPHLGGTNRGYRRLEAAKKAGLHTMVMVNYTKYGRGFVPKGEWGNLDLVKGPRLWTLRGKPARVKRLGGLSKYGTSVDANNASRVTRRLRQKWR